MLVTLLAAPGLAQDAPTTWTLETSVGVGGFIDPTANTIVEVTVSSQLLLVGRIDLAAGGATTSEAIEIPAGGVKTLAIEGPPVRDRRLVTVRLVDTSGEEELELEAQQVRVTVPLNQIVVGLVDAEAAEPGLRSATPEPIDFEVELVTLDQTSLERGLDVLGYLVVGDSALAGADTRIIDRLAGWVEDGGVLVGTPVALAPVADTGGSELWPGTSVGVRRLGAGELAAVSDLGSVAVDEWNVLIRGTENPGLTRNSAFGQGPGLISAASAGREASVPGLPWLLAGIVAFVVLVGPVNFVALRRFGRPELAWFTVPALSLVFVGGFWLAGRAQVADAAVTSAAVIVDADGDVVGSAGAVVQVATGGDRKLSFPDGWRIVPSEGFGLASGVRDPADVQSIIFTLEDLGVGAAEARVDGLDPVAVRIDVDADGTASVTNNTSLIFWNWGLVVDGVGYAVSSRDGDFEPGATATLAVAQRRRGNRYEPVILETAQRQAVSDPNFYETTYQTLNALSYHAETLDQDLARDGTYFYGFTDSFESRLAIDGRALDAAGSSLLIKEFSLPASVRTDRPVRPTLLDVEGSATVEQYYDEIYAYGADTVWFRYEVPADAPTTGSIRPPFTQLRVAEVYDWAERGFVPYTWGDPLDVASVVSPGGELILRASLDEEQEFFEESLQLVAFELTWSAS